MTIFKKGNSEENNKLKMVKCKENTNKVILEFFVVQIVY